MSDLVSQIAPVESANAVSVWENEFFHQIRRQGIRVSGHRSDALKKIDVLFVPFAKAALRVVWQYVVDVLGKCGAELSG